MKNITDSQDRITYGTQEIMGKEAFAINFFYFLKKVAYIDGTIIMVVFWIIFKNWST